jgi:glycosyltransferase involved in cell wall biosynthesis
VSIWFVTPAYRRYGLSAVCFDQRVEVIRALAAQGVEAHCVVVADDGNLDLAKARGFHVVRRNNEWLGRKFNDGMEYAGRHGAEWIVPIGSDSWIDPAYFLPLPEAGTRTSVAYCVVEATRLAVLEVRDAKGAGPYMFTRDQLEPCGFRPAADELPRHVDQSTVRGIARTVGPIDWRPRTVHPYQYIGLRGRPYLSSYGYLRGHWGVAEHGNPWQILARHYSPALVARAKAAMG